MGVGGEAGHDSLRLRGLLPGPKKHHRIPGLAQADLQARCRESDTLRLEDVRPGREGETRDALLVRVGDYAGGTEVDPLGRTGGALGPDRDSHRLGTSRGRRKTEEKAGQSPGR